MSVFRTTVKVDTAAALKKLKRGFVDQKLLQDIQTEIVDAEIKRSISRGLSPVRGFGRFGEYLNPLRYPGKGKKRQKPQRPVNLFLTGEMLSWLSVFRKTGSSLEIGIDRKAPAFVKTKAKANNLGTEVNGVGAVPRRRFIPQVGETWNVSVMRKIKNLFAERVISLFNK